MAFESSGGGKNMAATPATCQACQAELPAGAKFCVQCGRPIDLRCASCGTTVSPRARFCSECGAALAPAAGAPSETVQPVEAGDRRQLTVLFCDIVNSTALSHRLDPEELRTILRGYQEICAAAVAKFDGHLAKYMGDGVMAYFGYPQAHDDDARRAASAALEIVRSVRAISRELHARRASSSWACG